MIRFLQGAAVGAGFSGIAAGVNDGGTLGAVFGFLAVVIVVGTLIREKWG